MALNNNHITLQTIHTIGNVACIPIPTYASLQFGSIDVVYIWQITRWHVVAIATNTFSSTVTRRPLPKEANDDSR
jgi:hypothetical protein